MVNYGAMQVDAISLFCDVAQHRSVSRGAELHGVTQSAASQRIRTLERELGVQLIDTSTRPLQLTPAGEAYYHGCHGILESYARLRERVTGIAHHESLRGEVTVASIYSAGIDLLNKIRSDFESQHPRVTVNIEYRQPDAVADRVRSEQVDLGVISYPERWRDLASVPLRNEKMAVVVAAGHPLASRSTMTASDLHGLAMVSFENSLPIGRRIRRYLSEHGVEAHIEQLFDNIDTIKTFVAQTEAAALLPRRTVRREIERGILAAVELEPQLMRPVAIVYQKHRERTAPAAALIEFMTQHRPPEPPEAPPSESGRAKKTPAQPDPKTNGAAAPAV